MRKKKIAALLVAGWVLLAGSPAVGADGTETLGPPSVPVATGTGVAVGGVGLFTQPGQFTITIPEDAVVTQVLLYYEAGHQVGDLSGQDPDHTVRINGVVLSAGSIGGPTPFYGNVLTDTHRLDVTSYGFIGPGVNAIQIDGLDVDEVDDGAGMVVIYAQPGQMASVQMVDGNDIAFANFEPPRDTTVPQTFTFAPADVDRVASLAMLTGSVHDPAPTPNPSGNQKNRPNFVEIEVAGTTTRLADPFGDEAPEWDSGVLKVTIPAGATSLTVRYLSEYDATGDLPASLVWLAGTLVVPLLQPAQATTTTSTTMPPVSTTAPPPATVAATTATVAPGQPQSIPTTGTDPLAAAGPAFAAVALGAALLLAVRARRARRP